MHGADVVGVRWLIQTTLSNRQILQGRLAI